MRGRGAEPLPPRRFHRGKLLLGVLIGAAALTAVAWFVLTYNRRDPQQAPPPVFVPAPGNGAGRN